ncbi:peptidase M3A and M3B thimet/oligopeptidase F [Clostridium sp. 19966]|uniref:hypothetical protein n=1 Tax=Clostridium sp. 19966 TaxID=2768166 RepID=UPI0028DDA1C7|nr:hypothetical protein [Clostridium sp. 19966]MDT8715513.1 peptidase M3A and M3B thimet/oligopeptidase F [Clostridium sp. 19966]
MKNIYEIANKVNELEQQYERLEWVLYTAGYDFGTQETYNKLVDELSSEENFKVVEKAYNSSFQDIKEQRRSEIMYKKFKPYHLSKEINELSLEIETLTNKLSNILNKHRSKINGVEVSSVDIAQILSGESDRAKRKEAFLARSQVNKALVDGGFIELIKLRKEYAEKRGFKDFVEMKLDEDDLNIDIFKNWKKQVHNMLPTMRKTKEQVAIKYLNDTEIEPWDEDFISSKLAPALNAKVDMSSYYDVIRSFFLKFGIDISKFNITYDIFSRANKSEWGYNFPIATGKDSRILANVKNQYREYGVLLHETGHAVHSFLLSPDETILNYAVSGIISEGIANLFGGFIYEEIFYKQFFAATAVKEEFKVVRDYFNINSLTAVNSILFDQELYRNDINSLEDINNLAFKLQKDILGEDRYAEEYPWGYRIHHTTHPIYLHNYFMGDVTCEMLKKSFCKNYKCSSVIEKPLDFSEFLITSVISPSGLYKYPDLFKRISGEDFSLKYIL